MRRAEWRRRADDPTTTLGWWWRGIVGRDWRWPLGSVALAISAWARSSSWPWIVDPLAFGVFLACCLRKSNRKDALASLLPEPAPEGQFRASVEYRTNGIVTGRDEMALCIVDGWLHAEGVRSHFALRPEDAWRLTTGSDRRGRIVLSDGGEIRLKGLNDPVRIVLDRWHRPDRWMEGEPVFPPARVHLREIVRALAWMMGGFTLNGFSFVAKLFVEAFRSDLLQAVLVLVSLGMILFGIRRALRLMKLDSLAKAADEKEGPRTLARQTPVLQEKAPESLTAKRW